MRTGEGRGTGVGAAGCPGGRLGKAAVVLLGAASVLFGSVPVSAGSSTPKVKVVRVQASSSAYAIRLDNSVTVSNPHSACGSWSPNYQAYIQPAGGTGTDAMLATALSALAAGKEVIISASSCTTGDYPIIDTIYVHE